MAGNISRRGLLSAGAAVAAGAAVGGPALADTGSTRFFGGVAEETKSLEQLYADARAAGGRLVVYAGGDVAAQQEPVAAAFRAAFPDITLTVVVDYSKFHDARLDHQFATGSVVPDVVQLQTLHDFTRWKRQGRLLRYKPAGHAAVHREFKDPDGAWVAIGVIAFSFLHDVAAVSGLSSPEQLVDPRWKGLIASSYPQDDDAALFLYKLYAEAFGWDWFARLAAQDIEFARGTHTPGLAVNGKRKAIGVAAGGTLTAPATAPTRWVVPQNAPFMAWGQRAGLPTGSRNPAAGKLYLNWILSRQRQQAAFNGWSVRTDVTPPAGLRPIWEYPNANLDGFEDFMADRALVERWRQTCHVFFGTVRGEPSPGVTGLHPGR